MSGLHGKVALVTGGSRGIGAAIARRLAQDGADVALTYRDGADDAAAVVAEVEQAGRRGLALAADSADAHQAGDAVERTVSGLGRLDILVNNAGIFPAGPLEDVTPEEIDRTLAIHARAPLLAAQAAARHLGPGGRIISIGSCVADRVPSPGMSLYAMSKSALSGMTKGLARDLGPRDITVNLVQPGPTATDMNPSEGPGADAQRAATALGRYARPEEVAATVAHLAGDGGSYINGATIAVDGGFTA